MAEKVIATLIEEDKGLEEIFAMSFDKDVIRRALHMVNHNKYKHRQAPPGVKIKPRAFGRDCRLLIANQYTDQVEE